MSVPKKKNGKKNKSTKKKTAETTGSQMSEGRRQSRILFEPYQVGK